MDLPWASGTDLDELRRQLRQPRRVRRLPADEARLRDQLAAALDACNDGWAKPRARRSSPPGP